MTIDLRILIQYIQILLNIIQGYFIWLFNIIFKNTSINSRRRLLICNKCIYNKHGVCQLCGCIIKAKVRVHFQLDENGKSIDGCPLQKW